MEDKLAQSISVIIDMLKDRNMLDLDESSRKSYIELVRNSNPHESIEIRFDKIKIIYYLKKKYQIAEIKKLFNDNDGIEFYLLVTNGKFKSNDVKKIKEQLAQKRVDFQIFDLKELQFNPSHHELVPKHELVEPDEVGLVRDFYQLQSFDQLPIILTTDPMAKYIGLKPGQVVRIIRENPHSGRSVVFRWCKEPIDLVSDDAEIDDIEE